MYLLTSILSLTLGDHCGVNMVILFYGCVEIFPASRKTRYFLLALSKNMGKLGVREVGEGSINLV